MRLPRIYLDQTLRKDAIYELTDDSAHHVIAVLRMRKGQQLILFNGQGGQFTAEIVSTVKKRVVIQVGEYYPINLESELNITLAQGISRGQQMDYTIQKSVELGVARIVPVITEFCTVHLNNERMLKRHHHWKKIIIGACEQSGRTKIPLLEKVQNVEDWISQDTNKLKLILHPESGLPLSNLDKLVEHLTLLIGPEGGFSQLEYKLAQKNGYQGLKLGPRILRTETAALAAISMCQMLWGDIC
jgi:16S rRNA (uracil1498-N3)-methyltransferase